MIMNRMYRMIQYILVATLLIFLVACDGGNEHVEETPFETKFETAENIFDSIPLKILIHSAKYTDYGIENSNSELFSESCMLNLEGQISKECEDRFGFPIEFFSIKRAGQIERNDYRLFFESGEIADLIFPTKINPSFDHQFFWMDEFVDNGYYKDLTPYLSTYCPDVYLNMQRYDYIREMITRDDKIYALYAGVPDISSMVLQVKNELLTASNMQYIHNFDELFAFMEAMNQEEEPDENNRILVSYHYLLEYAFIKAGYYPLAYNNTIIGNDIVFKVDDPECKPYFIEDTNILDVFFEEFLPFFKKSYFLYHGKTVGDLVMDHKLNYLSTYIDANIRLTDNFFSNTYFNILYDGNVGHAMNDYSMFLFDAESIIVDSINSILLIPVPKTSTQPEKALSVVNWLFTDEKMADYLSFGTDQGNVPNYQFNDDGNPVYNQAGCPVYMFHNLIANFSDKLMPFQNKAFDRTDEYKRLAEKALHPPLYQDMESKHTFDRYFSYFSILKENKLFEERYKYIMSVMAELFTDPQSNITVDEIKEELRYITDEEQIVTFIEERLQYIIE